MGPCPSGKTFRKLWALHRPGRPASRQDLCGTQTPTNTSGTRVQYPKKELIEKGKKILENPDKPKFLEGNVKKIQEGWEETKEKAAGRLKLLQDTKEAWIGYAENSETIASDFEYCEEEIKKVKKKYNLQAAQDNLFKSIND